MKLRKFVSGSAIVLLGWLAITFVHKVPSASYPKLNKPSATTAARIGQRPLLQPHEVTSSATAEISLSR